MNPFDFVKSINQKNDHIIDCDPDNEKEYNPFLTNKALSFFPDTVMYVNELNGNPSMDKRMQYDYLYYSVRARKRWSEWLKKSEIPVISYIKDKFECRDEIAKSYYELMTDEQIGIIFDKMEHEKRSMENPVEN